ncbi:hypothetical protein BURMUCGD1_2358 [Burkholderia multivorans CGD1]|nr:hypothetical protein BURMUCGD1_2358 [Burkholderia multivorans CGD1]
MTKVRAMRGRNRPASYGTARRRASGPDVSECERFVSK